MNVIKRSGEEVVFNADKIEVALTKANEATIVSKRISLDEIKEIVKSVVDQCNALKRSVSVEEIQDMVERQCFYCCS